MKPWEVMQARKQRATGETPQEEPPAPGTQIKIVIEGCPVPKQRPRVGKGGRVYTPKKTRKYEKRVGELAGSLYRFRPVDHDVEIHMAIFWPDRRRRDLDNTVKSILDGMNKVVYADDYFVQRLVVERYIDRENPRAEVTVIL